MSLRIYMMRGFKYFCMNFPYDKKIRPYSFNYNYTEK